jgi:tRNA pseudouridine38-40 synthase
MRNIRLTLAYDGTDYVGWQIQPNGVSVQAAVEEALRQFTGQPVSLLAAGRTDAGVHAIGQVVNFQTDTTIPCQAFRAGLHTVLPSDIVLRDADEVGLAFHATHGAKRKHYRYVIYNGRPRHPFLRNYVHQAYTPLDVEVMHEAAQMLVGKQDFGAFESHHPNTATSVRTVFEAAVSRHSGWPTWEGAICFDTDRSDRTARGDFVWFDVVADGFLYNMVRAMVGTLIRVGERKWTTDDLRAILQSRDRRRAGSTAPACGLYLVRVEYDPAAVSPATVGNGNSTRVIETAHVGTPP